MIQDTHIQHGMTFASGSTATSYAILPCACTLRNATGVVQADPGDGETVTITGGGSIASGAGGAVNALGVLTFGSGIAAGATGTWVADTTTGSMTLLAGSLLKCVTSSGSASADVTLDIEIDPYAR